MNKEPAQTTGEALNSREISENTIPNLGKKSLSGVVEVAPEAEVQKPALIDSVPGITRTVESQAAVRTEPRAVISGIEFKGDPRRVIGHPSNEANQALQAYGDSLKK